MKIPNCLQIEATYTHFASGTMKAMFTKHYDCPDKIICLKTEGQGRPQPETVAVTWHYWSVKANRNKNPKCASQGIW